jgi:hypothetical protein
MSTALQITMICIVCLLAYIARLKGREVLTIVILLIVGSMLDDVDGVGPILNAITGFILDLPTLVADVISGWKAAT